MVKNRADNLNTIHNKMLSLFKNSFNRFHYFFDAKMGGFHRNVGVVLVAIASYLRRGEDWKNNLVVGGNSQ